MQMEQGFKMERYADVFPQRGRCRIMEMEQGFKIRVCVEVTNADGGIEYSYAATLEDAEEGTIIFPDRPSAGQRAGWVIEKLREIVDHPPGAHIQPFMGHYHTKERQR